MSSSHDFQHDAHGNGEESFEMLDLDKERYEQSMARQNGHPPADMPPLNPPDFLEQFNKAPGLERVSLGVVARSAVTVTDDMVSKLEGIARENLTLKELLQNVNNQLRDKVEEMQRFRDSKLQSSQKEARLVTEIEEMKDRMVKMLTAKSEMNAELEHLRQENQTLQRKQVVGFEISCPRVSGCLSCRRFCSPPYDLFVCDFRSAFVTMRIVRVLSSRRCRGSYVMWCLNEATHPSLSLSQS